MLLTSGQVSVAISSFVVFSFTGALFLSGYVLQQKTVRDIRTAIRPQGMTLQNQMYMPPQYEKSQIRVLGEDEGEFVVNVKQSSGSDATDRKKAQYSKGGRSTSQLDAKQGIEEGMTPIEAEQPRGAASSDQLSAARPSEKQVEEKPLSRAARRKKIKEEIMAAGEGEAFKGYRRRVVI